MAPADYVFVRRCRPVTNDGLPHSDTPGSKPYGGSPRLVAALCVLLRLLMPRHPSCARIRLARNLLEPLDLDIRVVILFNLQLPLVKELTKRLRYGTGGGSRIRTGDILLAKQTLYQLSYTPIGLPTGAGIAAKAGGPDKNRTCDLVLIRDAL